MAALKSCIGLCQRAREKNVVLQMNMPMQILFQIVQGTVERAERGAGIFRRQIVVGDFPQQTKLVAGMLVIDHDPRNRLLRAAKNRGRSGLLIGSELRDIGKKNAFFAEKMLFQFRADGGESLANLKNLWVRRTVATFYPVRQIAD